MSTVMVYSDDARFRSRVITAIGPKPTPGGEPVEFVEMALHLAMQRRVDAGGIDVCVLDGEAAPTGGLGISRQLKNELADCPAIIVVVARKDDTFLAGWSQADVILHEPLDPAALAAATVRLLRERSDRPPVVERRGLLGLRRR